MRNIFTRLWVVSLLLLVTATVSAQLSSLEVGQVYRFENVLYPTYSLNANSATDVNSVATSETDTKQQWYVEKQDGEYYVLRNLAYGKYLKGNGQSSAWSMSDDYSHDYNKFKLYTSNTDYNTLHTNTLANYAYIHCNSSYDIVGWSNGTTDKGSHWTITKVDYTTDDITALLEKAPTVAESAAYVTSLETLFADAACVTPALASLAAAQATDAYDALPATLKAMVDKVYKEKIEGVAIETAWTEDNANADKASAGLNWNGEYAKKFRVQMYEPYSIAGDITGFLRMNAHANNDNPTGIYVPGSGTVYVMVEGNIKDGATLRLINGGSNNRITDATTGGYELKTGLNVINFAAEAGMLYICYNVDTYDPNGASEELKFPHKLSEYPPLKIHIEGGAINGFYSSCGDYLAGRSFGDDLSAENNLDLWGGVDDDNDWIYMEERANLSVLPIISHRQILLFQLNEENGQQGMKHFLPESVSVPETPFSYPQNGETSSWDDYDAYGMDCNTTTGKINIWMETWDRIMHAELATLGLISEDNVNIMNKFYPRWTSDGSKAEIYDMTNAGPDGNTYKVFCNGRDYSEYYNHHGVSLGTTSGYMSAGWNAANYNNSTFGELMGMPTSGGLWGPVHEIGHQFQDVFNIRGATEVTNNVFSNAATWYQGISTSRYNGGNLTTTLDNFNSGLPFVDYNIWSMTQMFYKLWLYYHLAGNNTQFYPRFFEMLRVDPLNAKGATATGTESMLKIYEKMCDAAGEDLTEFFRAHGFFVLLDNYAKEDYGITIFTQTQEEVDAAIARVKAKYTKENFAVILINDGAEATLRHDGKTTRSFFDGTANPEYGGVNDFIDGSATTGGTYEAVVNNDGTVTMKGEGGIGFLVFDENGNIISFSDNSTFALSDEAKHAIVSGNATFVSVGSDVNSTPVTATVDLTAIKKDILGELIAKAQKIYDKIDDTYTKVGYFKAAAVASLTPALEAAIEVYNNSTGYEGAYEILYLEYTKIMDNPDSRITIDTSLAYTINNYAYTARNMTVSDSKVFANENASGTAAEWYFVESSTAGKYYLKNGDGKYCPTVTASAVQTVVDNEADAGLYYLYEIEYGLWAIKGTNSNMHASSSQSYNVVGWYDTAEASWWYVTAKTANETIEDLTNLQVLISKTEGLINEVSAGTTITKGAAYELQTTESGNPYYLTSNAPEDSEGSISYLVDGITGINSNYFHTEWSSEPPSGSHYLTVDLGADNTIERFTMSHTTRSGASSDFPKSADVYGSNDGTYYYYIGSTDRMPQSENTYWECSSAMVSVPYRYLRFNIHANRGYWHMAEFDIYPVTDISATVKDIYSTGDNVITVSTLTTALNKVLEAKALLKSNAPSKDDITAEIEVLNTAYEALLKEYNAILNSKLSSLNTITAATKTLIDEVGDITGNPFSGYVALQADSDTKAYYIWCNAQQASDPVANLLDGKANTILHTNWESTTAPEDGLDHHITVELGENNSISSFRFYYLSRESGGYGDYPTTIDIYGSTDGEAYEKFTTIEPRNSDGGYIKDGASWTSDIIDTPQPYVCLRFMVTATTTNRAKDGHYYWHMAEFKLERFSDLTFAIDNNYSATVSEELYASIHYTTEASSNMYATGTSSIASGAPLVTIELLDAQIADQQAAYDKLYAAKNNTAALKESLLELINSTQTLYNEMAADDGTVNDYYSTSTLTVDNLSEAFAQITAATEVYNSSSATVDEINTAYNELNAKYTVLKDIKDLDYTEERTIVTDIETAEDLLAEVMTAAEAPETVVLQNGDATQPYYIWCNKPANDSHGIAGGLIDKNDDGTANTSTFFGTYWNDGAVEPYAHYLEIDLGCVKSIENFAFDYTTRASGYENQRPNGIKLLVSNDKDVYNQVLAVTDGLAAGANEKWEFDAPFGFVGRYVRFAVSTQQGYFNMSDFNISFDAAYSLQEYYTTSGIDANLLTTLNDAVQQAVKARDCFVTEEMYNTAIANLTKAYNSLNTFKSAHISERTELDNLAGTAETLVTEVATINDTETAITMQCTDANEPYYLYCNAAGTENGGSDALGVAALVGDKATNTEHLHTAYKGSTDDDLDHYLRLDMGENEAMMSFKFSYTGRNDGNNNDPTVMLIEGSNDLENFEFITKLTDLPTSPTPTTYSSGVLGNGKAYRYIRFMVIETNNNAKYKDHPYFVLSQFAVTACKTMEVKSEYQSINLPLSKLVTANNEVVDAKAVVAENEHYLTETAYNEALDELKAAYNALNVAKDAQNIPVILTTDVNNPVLYKIKIKRSDTSVLEFDGAADATNMVAVDDDELGNKYQAWYFMQGTDADSNDDLLILPYWRAGEHNTTYRLASNSIGDGNSKVKAVDGTDDTYKQNWYITFTDGKTVADWWNIQPEGKATYFSNHGGTKNKMGFWADSAQSPGDDGSNFQFVLDETDYSKSDAYFELYNLHADCGGEKVSGEAIGCYTAATVETYNNAYNAATEKLADADATDDDYNSARTALEAAYNALTRNMPVVGGFYKIRSAYKTADDGDTYSYDGVVYADDNNNVYWAKDYDITSARAIWYIEPIEGGYNITNMHTGCSFTTLGWAAAATLSTTPATFTIDVLDDATGILKIVSGQPMHAQASGNKIVGYSGGLNSASAWTIEKVSVDDVVANIEHTITLAANTTGNDQTTGYSTLNLGYPVTVPAGVTAYIVTNSAIVDNTIELYEYASAGATIPANFPVILRGSIEESAGRAFKFNNAAVAAVDNVDNLLGGSNYTTYESCLDENGDNVYNIYMLTRKSGIVAMRWVYENYKLENGAYTQVENTASDDGGYVKCPANKVYLKLGGTTTQNLSTEYFFGIFSGTTDIDEVNTEENPLEGTIYDLQGRKIEEVTVPGFYIVNGKKVFINSELLK
ncbi:MAG: discoidin domain-containing protein [Bacteroidaceae bacterium]|nr:discoidin domain-containing protein [Bacteroidaceae bacterium]